MGSPGNNHAFSGRYNRRLVFDLIRTKGTISRGELVEATGLQPQTIANITRDLLTRGLLTETTRAAGGRGAPQKLLTLTAQAGSSIGLHLDRDRLTGVLCDLDGKEIARVEAQSPWQDPEEAVGVITGVTTELVKAAPEIPCWGIGVAMPTLQETGFEQYVGSPGWQKWGTVEFADALEAATGRAVIVENDATAAAIAELHASRDTDLTDFVYIFVGHGLGAGIIIEGLPFQGAFNNAGEIGLLSWPEALQPGKDISATPFSLEEMAQMIGCEMHSLSIDGALQQLYAQRDSGLMRWLALNGRRLQSLTAIIENLFDPQSVIVGGTLPPIILSSLVDRAYPLLPSAAARKGRTFPRLLNSRLAESASAIGAAMLPIIAHGSPHFRRLSLARGRKSPTDPETRYDQVAG